MMKNTSATTPDAYVAEIDGWRRPVVESLRAVAKRVRGLEEVLKWGHLVYLSNGPVLLIRAEEKRVLFGFWRGQRLREIEPRLKPGGKYEMATVDLREGDAMSDALAIRLVRAATALNADIGNPQDAAKAKPAPKKHAKSAKKAPLTPAAKKTRKKAAKRKPRP